MRLNRTTNRVLERQRSPRAHHRAVKAEDMPTAIGIATASLVNSRTLIKEAAQGG